MKNNKGVTLTSLTVYIIVLAIILVLLTFISANFTSDIGEVTGRGKISNELIKLYSFIISDIKSSSKVIEFSDDYVKFDNGTVYTVRYLRTLRDKEREVKQFELYRNNAMISENIMEAKFDYNDIKNQFYVSVKYIYGKTIVQKEQYFKVGRGY